MPNNFVNGKHRPLSDCANAQSNLGPCFPLMPLRHFIRRRDLNDCHLEESVKANQQLITMYVCCLNLYERNGRNHVRPAKIQIRLRIRAVWSESSLGALWIDKGATFLQAGNGHWSDYADAQADLSLCWAHMSEGTVSDVAVHMSVIPKGSDCAITLSNMVSCIKQLSNEMIVKTTKTMIKVK